MKSGCRLVGLHVPTETDSVAPYYYSHKMNILLRNLLLLIFLFLTKEAYSLSLKDALEAVGYSEGEVAEIVRNGQRAKKIIDTRYKLGMLGYTEPEIQVRMDKLFPQPKTAGIPPRRILLSGNWKVFQHIVAEASKIHSVPEALIYAVIKVESNFYPRAVSNKGAVGMMQLMPETARFLKVDNSFDPQENILGGTRYLSLLTSQFGGDLDLVLAAYIAGPERIEKLGRRIPNDKVVQKYIEDVKKSMNS